MFLERFIESPRHIEIQVLADAHGNVVHLGERECSIQRRNQKIVEEAPSTFLDHATRAGMGAQAVALAKAVSYRSAGTVEFIVDRERNFYFLEMNTRLQVEHPVTELVTGIDLVEEMIRIAAGEPLRIRQSDIRASGWAIEARIYAENAFRDFLPSVGRLTYYRPPREESGPNTAIRVDTGVVEGSEISLYYDPLVAKLCAWAPDRASATERMADALDAFTLEGVRHNIPFLAALMQHPRWKAGDLSTGFIAEEYPDGFRGVTPDAEEAETLVCVVLSAALTERDRLQQNRTTVSVGPAAPSEWVVNLDRIQVAARMNAADRSPELLRLEVAVNDGRPITIETGWRPGERVWRGRLDSKPLVAQVQREGHALRISRRGVSVLTHVLTPPAAAHAALMPERVDTDRSKALLCPMPGLVVSISVAEGQRVQGGEVLATVEAMKMENVLRAERTATVRRILAKPGDSLAVDDVIMEFA
jgi:propionyl-CoA carboxylase alpha chain